MRRNEKEFTDFAVAAGPRLRRTAYLVCGDWDLASDVVQEALIKVYVAWPRIERRGGLHAYARQCAVTTAIDWGRKRSSTELPTEHAAMDRPSDRDEHGSATELGALRAALQDLPPGQRACLVLRFLEDLR